MAEQRLIDANNLGVGKANPDEFERKEYACGWNNALQAVTYGAPTINPESLPVVRQLREELARVTAERYEAIKELDEVTIAVDELADFVDREIHPVIDYNLYLDLRENVDAVSMFQYENKWRGLQKEEP